MQSITQILKTIAKEGDSGEFIYKDIRCTWVRDAQLGYLSAYIHIPKGHFNRTITKKDGTQYEKYKRVERKDILKRFPIITYFQPCKNVQTGNNNVFGISAATFPSILPYVYDEQRIALGASFANLKYMSLKDVKLIIQKIIDYIVDTHMPYEYKRIKCTVCGVTVRPDYNGKCKNCYELIKQGRFAKRKPRKGIIATRKLNR